MKEIKLNSFAVHPQFKSTYHCEECKKLMNHGTTPTPASTGSPTASSSAPTATSPSTGGSDTPDKPASIAGAY